MYGRNAEAEGEVLWEKFYLNDFEGVFNSAAYSAVDTPDGGYLIGGFG